MYAKFEVFRTFLYIFYERLYSFLALRIMGKCTNGHLFWHSGLKPDPWFCRLLKVFIRLCIPGDRTKTTTTITTSTEVNNSRKKFDIGNGLTSEVVESLFRSFLCTFYPHPVLRVPLCLWHASQSTVPA